MSLVHLANLCAHIKNCNNVRVAITSIPYSRMHLQAVLGLYKQGFISGIKKGSIDGPDEEPTDVTPDNISSRRLWIDFKYRNNQSVIRDISLISKPSKPVHLSTEDVKALASGLQVRKITPLQPAEAIFIGSRHDIYEIHEAAQRNLEGLALFRVK
ncbi:37S ribosomal protein S8 mitochondrial [Spathaspora sp. JA1]|nr:37S ribosomal protein S8 mitochondrial [Spathaspora sp. JA1]